MQRLRRKQVGGWVLYREGGVLALKAELKKCPETVLGKSQLVIVRRYF